MKAGRDWKEFNDAWRKHFRLGRWLWFRTHGLRYRFRRFCDDPQKFAFRAEPWGVVLAAIGLFLALASFWYDYRDRVDERTVRAWQLLTAEAPGNSGKREALEYLNSESTRCILGRCKQRVALTGIDLSVEEGQAGAYLPGADLNGANLNDANLSGAVLSGANLAGADLTDADLSRADLSRADLTRARLDSANLSDANLGDAKLGGALIYNASLVGTTLTKANLSGAKLVGANLSGAVLYDANLSGADLHDANLSGADLRGADLRAASVARTRLDSACRDQRTMLPAGLAIAICFDEWFLSIEEEWSLRRGN